MPEKSSDESYNEEETEQRLRKTLRAAFRMKPTPLKAIPRKRGKAQPPRSRTARKVASKPTKRRA